MTYAQTPSISCEFRNSCLGDESQAFYANALLSSNTRIIPAGYSSNYSKILCCSSPLTNLKFTTVDVNQNCEGKNFMYFTSDTNARVAYTYNSSYHKYKMCVKTKDQSTDLDILVVKKDLYDKYLSANYACMFRTNDIVNGHMASCDSTFGSGQVYDYSVVGRVFDAIDTTPCNPDCTNELDGRIYGGCRNKVPACILTPQVCDGSIKGAWVVYNDTHEVKCTLPWNEFRKRSFTKEGVDVETITGECNNFIKKEFNVRNNGEQISMMVYVCQK